MIREAACHRKAKLPVAATRLDAVENRCHRYLVHRALQSPGVQVHAIGGTADHVRLVVSLPPTLLLSEWIGPLKGASAHHINHEICNRRTLDWQTGYGVVSFGSRDLPWAVDYVRDQKRHHAGGRAHDRLERILRPDEPADEQADKPVETGSPEARGTE